LIKLNGLSEDEIRKSKLILLCILEYKNLNNRWPTENELSEILGYPVSDNTNKVLSITDEGFEYLVQEGLIELDKNKLN